MNLTIQPHPIRHRARTFHGLAEPPQQDRGLTLEEQRSVDVSLLVVSGAFSVATLGVFASGNYRLGYIMSMVGGTLGTIFASLRLWSSYDHQIRARDAGRTVTDPFEELLR